MAIELDDGTIIRSLPEQVTKNKEDVEDLQNGLTTLQQQVASALAGVFHYKGSVATYSDLPASGNEVGDVYNVNDTGKNYAWSGSAWDDLAGIVDLSNLVTLDTAQIITGYKTFNSIIDAMNGISVGQGGVITDLQGGIRFSEYNGVNLDYENAALFPAITSTVDLGLDSNLFNRIYTTGLTINNPNVSGGRWTFVSGADVLYLRLGSTEQTYYFFEVGVFRSPSHVPTSANTHDLGSSTYTWRNIYLSGNICSNGGIGFRPSNLSYNAVQIVSSAMLYYVTPRGGTDGGYDLGTSTYRWRNLYLSGNLSDGTNAVNIADLKALIDYAKAQGWIS